MNVSGIFKEATLSKANNLLINSFVTKFQLNWTR